MPDSKTIWEFRDKITDLGLVEEMFSMFLFQPQKNVPEKTLREKK